MRKTGPSGTSAFLNRPLPLYVLTVLVWCSSSAPPEKLKRIALERKECANDVCIAHETTS
jgi:hypothetical protein